MILTNTQLIFLKDTVWALTLNEQIERLETASDRPPGTLLLSTFTDFKPDEVIGLTASAAVFDRSYTKVGGFKVHSRSLSDSMPSDSMRMRFGLLCHTGESICYRPVTSRK